MTDTLINSLVSLLRDPLLFIRSASGLNLRDYQVDVVRAVLDSIFHNRGLSFVVMFPRQSGKNETQAQLETYLLLVLSQIDSEIVKISPTWKPQSLNAMRRLERVLSRNVLTGFQWTRESGYIYRLGKARIFFFSGSPEANIVGATGSTLLQVDEAQDVLISKFDKDIAPMAASTNATRIFWGTAWTSQTLLARELRASLEAEKADGVRRVFRITADQVAEEVPAYGKFVADQVARLGRSNPMIKSQFYSEEIDSAGGMFPPSRLALMQGSHPPLNGPASGRSYAFLLDVAGEETSPSPEGSEGQNGHRDSTALTIVEIDPSTCADPVLRAPSYKVVSRSLWTGLAQTALYTRINALAGTWRPQAIIVDATGVGAGLASFLERSQPGRIVPFVFSQATKSKLGWDFISLIESGRFKTYSPSPLGREGALHSAFLRQAEFCQFEIIPGPSKSLRWGVPDGSKDPADGSFLHDDLVISAALTTQLDSLNLVPTLEPLIIHSKDPLKEMDYGY